MDPAIPATLDLTFWLTAIGIVLLLGMSAFFSGSETALTAASRAKLRARADKGEAGAEAALIITEDNERLIGSLLLGNNVVNILAASLATALLTRLFGANGVAVATLVMTTLVLIFSEVLPKTYAITRPEAMASKVARMAWCPARRGPRGCTQTMSSSSAQQAIRRSMSACCRAS